MQTQREEPFTIVVQLGDNPPHLRDKSNDASHSAVAHTLLLITSILFNGQLAHKTD